MKIVPKRDMIRNISYGTVVYTLDDFGNPETDDPLIVLNGDYKEQDDCVICASLDDGSINFLDDNTVVELVDAKLVINKF